MIAIRTAGAAVAGALLLIGAAQARWRPEYGQQPAGTQAWYQQQHNDKGQWCCDQSDGHPFFGTYKMNEDGSVTIDADGGPRTLPAYMILKGGNPTGHAVWWYLEVGNQHHDYCFAPGACC